MSFIVPVPGLSLSLSLTRTRTLSWREVVMGRSGRPKPFGTRLEEEVEALGWAKVEFTGVPTLA
jgi:hypothetical protein